MKTWLLKIFQKALNRCLSLDPESKQRLAALNGKTVTLELLGTGLIYQLYFQDNQIVCESARSVDDSVTQHCQSVAPRNDELDHPPTQTHIKGTPLSLLHMACSQDRQRFFADDVTISGDLELAQEVIDLFDHLEIDWEEYVSGWIGDIPAHQLKQFSQRLKNFNAKAQEVLTQNVNEYVHEEINLFPPEEALNDFFTDVDELRMDVDRMAMRIERLKGECK